MGYGLKERVLNDLKNAKKGGAMTVKMNIKNMTTAMKKVHQKKKTCKYFVTFIYFYRLNFKKRIKRVERRKRKNKSVAESSV